jgi:hypothetical protein
MKEQQWIGWNEVRAREDEVVEGLPGKRGNGTAARRGEMEMLRTVYCSNRSR